MERKEENKQKYILPWLVEYMAVNSLRSGSLLLNNVSLMVYKCELFFLINGGEEVISRSEKAQLAVKI